ncbi:hypothetical protein [Salegentibacter holothuriorum]|uniref:hypothetical protein n=1 Tax=Salegentibacter holothuriorum TaxID=241145 RepID=UPI00159135B8|nr:hypothetical protein [Salegentibacter holothuriorum]
MTKKGLFNTTKRPHEVSKTCEVYFLEKKNLKTPKINWDSEVFIFIKLSEEI